MNSSFAHALILNDDWDTSSLLSAVIQKEGLTCVITPDRETALQIIPLAKPKILLVKDKMGGIDNTDVFTKVKENDPHLPVVLITANGEISDSVAAIATEAFDYLVNPFDHSEVIRVVRSALSERERRRCAHNEDIAAIKSPGGTDSTRTPIVWWSGYLSIDDLV
jgi:DNA-binding NtrC family response regulator